MLALECFLIITFILFPNFQMPRKGNIIHGIEKDRGMLKEESIAQKPKSVITSSHLPHISYPTRMLYSRRVL